MATLKKTPDISFRVLNDTSVAIGEIRNLFVGVKGSDGTATDGQVVELTNSNYAAIVGKTSLAYQMCKDYFSINTEGKLDFLPIANNGSASATVYELEVTGTATKAGTVKVYAGRYDDGVEVSFNKNDDNDAVSAAIVKAFETKKASMLFPTIAKDDTDDNKTKFTSGDKGDTSAYYHFSIDDGGSAGTGVTYTLTQETKGTGTNVELDLELLKKRYHFIVMQEMVNYSGIVSKFKGNFYSGSSEINDSWILWAHRGTVESIDFDSLVGDSPTEVIFADIQYPTSTTHKFGTVMRTPYEVLIARFVAIKSLALTDGSDVSKYITSRQVVDQTGGLQHASLPFFNTIISETEVPEIEYFPTIAKQKTINDDYGSLIGPNTNGSLAICGEVLTTRRYDPVTLADDDTFKYLNYSLETSKTKEYYLTSLRQEYAQSRMVNALKSSQEGVVAINDIRASMMKYRAELVELLIVPDGVNPDTGKLYSKEFSDNMEVTFNAKSGNVNIYIRDYFVVQLRSFDLTMYVKV